MHYPHNCQLQGYLVGSAQILAGRNEKEVYVTRWFLSPFPFLHPLTTPIAILTH